MATELTMPKNDMDMEEGTIVKWLKNVGDKRPEKKVRCSVGIEERTKTSMEIESPGNRSSPCSVLSASRRCSAG